MGARTGTQGYARASGMNTRLPGIAGSIESLDVMCEDNIDTLRLSLHTHNKNVVADLGVSCEITQKGTGHSDNTIKLETTQGYQIPLRYTSDTPTAQPLSSQPRPPARAPAIPRSGGLLVGFN